MTFLCSRMIVHDPHDWIRPVLDVHRSTSFRKALLPMLMIGFFTAVIVLIERRWLKLPDSHPLHNITTVHTLLGFAISMLLVFRTNTAYDRWWEGRKLWSALVNNSRNLAIKLSVMLDDEKDRQYFRKMIPSYASMLHKHLNDNDTGKALFDNLDLAIDHHKHKPNQVAQMMFHKINDLYDSKKFQETNSLF